MYDGIHEGKHDTSITVKCYMADTNVITTYFIKSITVLKSMVPNELQTNFFSSVLS
jgi:hypothetical protein